MKINLEYKESYQIKPIGIYADKVSIGDRELVKILLEEPIERFLE